MEHSSAVNFNAKRETMPMPHHHHHGHQPTNVVISDNDSGCSVDEYAWVPLGLNPEQVRKIFALQNLTNAYNFKVKTSKLCVYKDAMRHIPFRYEY